MNSSDWDKLTHNYHEFIISPFAKGVKNPLISKLKKISSSSIVADIGCGRGEILPILSKKFKKVYALDFSKKMLKFAKEHNSRKNISFHLADVRQLDSFKNKFDCIIAVNSIVMPKLKDVSKSIDSVYSTLKKGGIFFGIFPSMEAILYQAFLINQDQLKKHNEKDALKKTKKILEFKKYNFLTSIYDDDEKQKFYYDFELKIRLSDADFKKIKISKVLYPWGISDYEDFFERPKLWDWFVSAEK